LEISAETEFSDQFAHLLAKQNLLFKFSNSVTQNGAIQTQPHAKIKPHQNPLLQNRISPPTSPAAGK
jgi:hypothetical protein